MPDKRSSDVQDIKTQIKTIAESSGVTPEQAQAIAEKCYTDVYWRPYGGATSFAEIDETDKTRKYIYALEDETYKLRGIVENITDSDELQTGVKAQKIREAASDYESRVSSINIEDFGRKTFIGKVVGALMGETKTIKKEGSKWVLYTKDGKRKLGTHDTRSEAVDQEAAIESKKKGLDVEASSFKVFEDSEGNYRWISFSSNAFEDLESEVMSTKALEEAVEYADENGERGPLLVHHFWPAQIGQCDYQAVQGRFLIESGTFDDTPVGQKALEYFVNSDEEHQVSIGFNYIIGDEDDGTYDWLRIKERSVCPSGIAANPWTDFKVFEGDKMKAKQEETLIKIFGEEQARQLISSADTKTKELETSQIRFKTNDKEEVSETFIRSLAKTMGVNEEEAVEAAKKLQTPATQEPAAQEKTETSEGKKENENSPAIQLDQEKLLELGTMITDIAEAVDKLSAVPAAVTQLQEEVKALKASDDEKIAAALTPKGNSFMRPTGSNENEVNQELVNAAVQASETKTSDNPAQKYIDDLAMGINGAQPARN